MKKIAFLAVTASLLSAGSAHAFEDTYTLGINAGTTGAGLEAAWRFSEHFGVSANYAGGLDYDGDFDTDEATYSGDIDLQAGALKLDYFPFGGRFFLTAGAAMPDMTASVVGQAKGPGFFEINGIAYPESIVGNLNGEVVIADSIQPYLGLGWRSSNEKGFGFFSEFGVFTTDVDVSLSSESNFEANSELFASDLAAEEQRLKDDAEELSVYPVATVGVTYTF